MTCNEAKALIDGVEGILESRFTPVVDVYGTVKKRTLEWLIGDASTNVAKSESATLVIKNYVSDDDGNAYWLKGLPAVLEPSAERTYFGDHEITRSQILSYAHSQWKTGARLAASDITAVRIVEESDRSIIFSGLFDTVTETPRLIPSSYRIWLVDPAQPATGVNIKFERIT